MGTKGVSNMDVKRSNRRNTFKEMLKVGTVTQAELVQSLDLSWPTVLQNIKELVDAGLVRETGRMESTGGRRPKGYSAVADAKVALGVDIAKTKITGAVVDLRGDVVAYEERRVPFTHDHAWDAAFAALVGVLGMRAGDRARILGLGITLPAVLSRNRDTLVYSDVLKLADVPMRHFAQRLPYDCSFMNAANAAALAEAHKSGEPLPALYLSLDDTIGGGLVFRDALYRGAWNKAGEFGHVTLVPEGRECYCGQKGCFVAYCSARTLADHAGGDLDAFFEGLEQGHGEMAAAWEEYLDYLSIAVNNVYQALDCPIILGGPVGWRLRTRMEELRQRVVARSAYPTDGSYLRPSSVPVDAPAVGAALGYIWDYLDSL